MFSIYNNESNGTSLETKQYYYSEVGTNVKCSCIFQNKLNRARDKGNIRVKYPYVLSKYSIIFKNLGIATQLI